MHLLPVLLAQQQVQVEHQQDSQHQQVVYLVDLHQQLYQEPLEQLTLEATQQMDQVEHREHQQVDLTQPQEQHLALHLAQHQEELVEQLQQQVALAQVDLLQHLQ